MDRRDFYSLASLEKWKLMRAFAQINLSQFVVRSCGERSCLQQENNSQISFFFLFNLFYPFSKFDDGV